jgi:hypothetical protein
VHEAFGWGRAEFLACNLDALEAAFVDESTRATLRERLLGGWASA